MPERHCKFHAKVVCPTQANPGVTVARRRALHAKGGLGRYSPPTRGLGAHAAATPATGHRVRPAVALVGTGLLASTGLLGLAVCTASPSGASVGVECTGTTSAQDSIENMCVSTAAGAYAGFGNLISDTANHDSAIASGGGVAYAGSENTSSDQTANNDTAIAASGAAAYAGSYGIGSKSTTTSNDTAFATTGGVARAGTGAGNSTTADNDSATAVNGGTALAGSNDTTTTANNDTANANGSGATASAGSNDTTTTANNDNANAISVDGGIASSIANGSGVLAFTLAYGPTAEATATATSATTSAGPGSVAVAFNNSGQISVSANGLTI